MESEFPENLSRRKCKPCEGGTRPLNLVMIKGYLTQLPGWELSNPSNQPGGAPGKDTEIQKTFTFKNYYETIAFVNAVAWMAHQENHHPDLEVGYKTLKVRFTTHALQGLSENDFICASKIEALLSAAT